MTDRIRSKEPASIKDALKQNVRHQQRRTAWTESPPEAQRSPRERIKDAERKQKRDDEH